MSQKHITRRQFMERTVAGAAATGMALSPNPAKAKVSPNDKVNIAIIGAGIRGLEHLGYLHNEEGANVVMVCDLYDGHLRRA